MKKGFSHGLLFVVITKPHSLLLASIVIATLSLLICVDTTGQADKLIIHSFIHNEPQGALQ